MVGCCARKDPNLSMSIIPIPNPPICRPLKDGEFPSFRSLGIPPKRKPHFPRGNNMNSAQSYFLISLLLITALIAIICLLILATDQPDAMLEGQRRRIVMAPKLRQDNLLANPNQESVHVQEGMIEELEREWNAKNNNSMEPSQQPEIPPEYPVKMPMQKLEEFGPYDGGKFVSLSLWIQPGQKPLPLEPHIMKSLEPLLMLAKDNGQIEIRGLPGATSERGKELEFVQRIINLPVRIYRCRPVNTSLVAVLDASFTRIQLWNVEVVPIRMEAERVLEHPAKDIALEGNMLFTLGRFDDRIDAFDIGNGLLAPIGKEIHIGEHCNSMARGNKVPSASLLLICPSGLLEISPQNGQILRNLNQSADVTQISAVQGLSNGIGNLVVLAASRTRREMMMFDWSGNLGTIFQETQAEKGLWLWTAVAMYEDRIYALEYIRNRVEVFKIETY